MTKETLGKYLKELINAIIAGLLISLGSIVFISCTASGVKPLGVFLFSTGLLLIMLNGYSLVTGKNGYILDNKPTYLIECLISWIGNFIGTFLTSLVISNTRICDITFDSFSVSFMSTLESICQARLNDNYLSLIILGFFCGMLIFFAVNTYKKAEQPIAKFVMTFLCIALFIYCNFEHCVADMCYFNLYAFTHNFTNYGQYMICLLFITLGNVLGGIFIPGLTILRDKINKKPKDIGEEKKA